MRIFCYNLFREYLAGINFLSSRASMAESTNDREVMSLEECMEHLFDTLEMLKGLSNEESLSLICLSDLFVNPIESITSQQVENIKQELKKIRLSRSELRSIQNSPAVFDDAWMKSLKRYSILIETGLCLVVASLLKIKTIYESNVEQLSPQAAFIYAFNTERSSLSEIIMLLPPFDMSNAAAAAMSFNSSLCISLERMLQNPLCHLFIENFPHDKSQNRAFFRDFPKDFMPKPSIKKLLHTQLEMISRFTGKRSLLNVKSDKTVHFESLSSEKRHDDQISFMTFFKGLFLPESKEEPPALVLLHKLQHVLVDLRFLNSRKIKNSVVSEAELSWKNLMKEEGEGNDERMSSLFNSPPTSRRASLDSEEKYWDADDEKASENDSLNDIQDDSQIDSIELDQLWKKIEPFKKDILFRANHSYDEFATLLRQSLRVTRMNILPQQWKEQDYVSWHKLYHFSQQLDKKRNVVLLEQEKKDYAQWFKNMRTHFLLPALNKRFFQKKKTSFIDYQVNRSKQYYWKDTFFPADKQKRETYLKELSEEMICYIASPTLERYTILLNKVDNGLNDFSLKMRRDKTEHLHDVLSIFRERLILTKPLPVLSDELQCVDSERAVTVNQPLLAELKQDFFEKKKMTSFIDYQVNRAKQYYWKDMFLSSNKKEREAYLIKLNQYMDSYISKQTMANYSHLLQHVRQGIDHFPMRMIGDKKESLKTLLLSFCENLRHTQPYDDSFNYKEEWSKLSQKLSETYYWSDLFRFSCAKQLKEKLECVTRELDHWISNKTYHPTYLKEVLNEIKLEYVSSDLHLSISLELFIDKIDTLFHTDHPTPQPFV